jgi:hypothetical protein
MVHLHDQIADLGLELFVLGFQLAFPVGWTIDQRVVVVLMAPPIDQASRNLLFARGLSDGLVPGFDLGDQLTFEFGFELSTDFSHYELLAPLRPAKSAGREGLWKMPHPWKSAQDADSHTMLGKASHKTARLSHIYHSLGGDGSQSSGSR